MSASCCGHEATFEGLDARKRILWIVIGINALMFPLEIVAGVLARSQARQADAIDFLGDTMTYGIALAVIGKPARARDGCVSQGCEPDPDGRLGARLSGLSGAL